ncbi:hypothetical protein WJX73_007040 [Symbiochloris irregularis]|uniref:Uncharacterized protein n=1 Tax=Symbiochloris irregularis TaxID=706552 RepID=A0AAW1PDX0_9CHLO
MPWSTQAQTPGSSFRLTTAALHRLLCSQLSLRELEGARLLSLSRPSPTQQSLDTGLQDAFACSETVTPVAGLLSPRRTNSWGTNTPRPRRMRKAYARTLIAEKYPALLHTYDAYPYAIERADVVRYAILDTYGGFYLDLDIECRVPLDFMRPYPFVMPATKPVGFSNDFMASIPKHPLLKQMLAALPRWRMPLLTKYPTVMFSTGPMFVTMQASVYVDRSALWVLPDAMYGKYVHRGANPLFHHLHGSSWHGDDAKSVLWFVRHPLFLVLICIAAACGGILWLLVSVRFNAIRRWSSSSSEGKGDKGLPLTQVVTLKSS